MADTSKCFSLIRGRMMRVTRLDGCGGVVLGSDSQVTTKGFVTIALTAQTDEGTTISVTNAAGDICISDVPAPKFTGYAVEVAFCGVNPDLYSMMTGQARVLDGDELAVGFRMNSSVNADDSGFALEVWSSVPTAACAAGETAAYGYFLIPFLKGGILGDFTIANDAINFTLSGANSKDGNAWGVGPYNVVDSAGDEIQKITITGTPTGGTFTLTFASQTTAGIAFNATAAVVQTALEALSNIAPGDVLVSGGPGPSIPYIIEFKGAYRHTDVAAMTASAASLTGGTTPAVTPSTVQAGSASTPSPLLLALDSDDHLHLQYTTVAPPSEVDCGTGQVGVPATGATAGIPGAFTPSNSYAPDSLVQMPGVIANPLTAWTTGQYVTTKDGAKVHWSSTAWVAGVA